jgi:hypothetical protein
METRRSAGFPADVLVALILPAMAIFALVFGPQRIWILLLIAGFVQMSGALLVLRRSRSSAAAWLALVAGIMAVAIGIRFAFTA